MGTTIGEKGSVQRLPPKPDPEIRTIGEAMAPLVEEAKGWVNKQYQKGVAEMSRALEATVAGTGEFMSKVVGQVGDLAKSALQSLESDVFTKLPPEPQASVGEAKAAITLAAQQAAAAQKLLATSENRADLFATIPTELRSGMDESMKALAKCQAEVQQGARSGDKACKDAQISVSNLLQQWMQARVNWRV